MCFPVSSSYLQLGTSSFPARSLGVRYKCLELSYKEKMPTRRKRPRSASMGSTSRQYPTGSFPSAIERRRRGPSLGCSSTLFASESPSRVWKSTRRGSHSVWLAERPKEILSHDLILPHLGSISRMWGTIFDAAKARENSAAEIGFAGHYGQICRRPRKNWGLGSRRSLLQAEVAALFLVPRVSRCQDVGSIAPQRRYPSPRFSSDAKCRPRPRACPTQRSTGLGSRRSQCRPTSSSWPEHLTRTRARVFRHKNRGCR